MSVQTLERKLKAIEEPVENGLLRWLYLHLPLQPITSKEMHNTYAKAMSILLNELELEGLQGDEKAAAVRYMRCLAPFLEEFERRRFKVGAASPEEMLGFLMEQHQLTQYDLAKELGGQPVVSDVLHGKRRLTREHIERLSKRFHVSPATFYSPHANPL